MAEKRIGGLTIHDYCERPDLVRKEATEAGVLGEPIKYHHMTKGRFNGRVTVKHNPLNNMQLWQFAKDKYATTEGDSDESL